MHRIDFDNAPIALGIHTSNASHCTTTASSCDQWFLRKIMNDATQREEADTAAMRQHALSLPDHCTRVGAEALA